MEDDGRCSMILCILFTSIFLFTTLDLYLNSWQDFPVYFEGSFPFPLLRVTFLSLILSKHVSHFDFSAGARTRGSLLGLIYTHRCNLDKSHAKVWGSGDDSWWECFEGKCCRYVCTSNSRSSICSSAAIPVNGRMLECSSWPVASASSAHKIFKSWRVEKCLKHWRKMTYLSVIGLSQEKLNVVCLLLSLWLIKSKSFQIYCSANFSSSIPYRVLSGALWKFEAFEVFEACKMGLCTPMAGPSRKER